ncbi:MAG: EamA family transporter, partial [Saprospiraceae bacterium]|nr:EamA family transporter [Saprospiraceae bacterium]
MSKFFPHAALFSVALIYGANYTVAKSVLNGGYIPPIPFVLFRVLFGLILFQLVRVFFIKEKVDRADWGRLFLCGIFGVAMNQLFFFMGLEKTTPIHASLIMLSTPLAVLILASIILKEPITSKKLLGIALGAAGAALLISQGSGSAGKNSYWLGDLMIMINAVSYGMYLVLVKPLMNKYNPMTIIAWLFLAGSFVVFPAGIFQVEQINWSSFQIETWVAFAYVLIFTTAATYALNAYAIKKLNPSIVSVYIYLQPLIAGMISLWVGQDTFQILFVIAGLLIFAGVYLVSAPNKVDISRIR